MNDWKSQERLERNSTLNLRLERLSKKEKLRLAAALEGYIEYPVTMKEFIEGPDYLNAAEMWQTVKDDLIELFDSPKKYERAVFCEGIGAGKSYKTSAATCYLLYRLLNIRDPQLRWELAPGSTILILNMASNAKQANKVVFNEVKNRIDHCKWFRQNNFRPDPNIMSELRFPKNIVVMPGNSSATYPIGYNLFSGVLDEAAWYTETEEHDLAEEIYGAMDSRIASRFGADGMLITISSPRYVDDYIEKLMAQAETNPKIFSKRRATWESKTNWKSGITFDSVHPKTKEVVKIPIELQNSFLRNPEKSWRDFGAVASEALEPYMKQYDLVMKCVDTTLPTIITEDGILTQDAKPDPNAAYYMHVDLALVSDACGIAMCHMGEDGETVIVDMIHRIQGNPEKEVDVGDVRRLIQNLHRRGYYISMATYDQFQSASSIQELNKAGIMSEKLSVDANLGPYETLKGLVYEGKIKYHSHEVFLREMKRLELVEGKKVDHPARGSKDCADAVAGAVFNCISADTSGTVTASIV